MQRGFRWPSHSIPGFSRLRTRSPLDFTGARSRSRRRGKRRGAYIRERGWRDEGRGPRSGGQRLGTKRHDKRGILGRLQGNTEREVT